MRIILDDQPCDVSAGNVGEAIASGAAIAEKQGRFIVEVVVDGDAWTDAQLSSEEHAAAAAEEVRLTSADPASLVGQTFAQASEALGDAQAMQLDAAALLQSDKQAEGMEQLHEALAIWISVQQAVVQGSQLMGLDLDTCTIKDQPVPQVIQGLNERLESLRSQLESKDTVGVADTLLYDLPGVVEQWRDLLDDLQRRVETA